MIYLGVGLFGAGTLAAFWIMFRYERQVRRDRMLDRSRVRSALVGLLIFGMISGCGMALLGMSAFIGARGAPAGVSAYLWAVLLAAAAFVGWPVALVAAFMARVNALE